MEYVVLYVCGALITYLALILALIFSEQHPYTSDVPSFFIVLVFWPFVIVTTLGSYIQEYVLYIILTIRERVHKK